MYNVVSSASNYWRQHPLPEVRQIALKANCRCLLASADSAGYGCFVGGQGECEELLKVKFKPAKPTYRI